MKRLLFLSAVLALLLCLLPFAPAGASSGSPEKGTLILVTRQAGSHDPVGGVSFSVRNTRTGDQKTVRTNASGKKSLRLSPGTYEIEPVSARKGWKTPAAKTVTVRAGREKTKAFTLTPVYSCRVKVKDSESRPVAGARVSLCGRWAETDADGLAVLTNVEYGKNELTVTVWKGLRAYLPYAGTVRCRGKAGSTLRFSVHLPPEEEWVLTEPVIVAKKPVLYLYSKEERDVTVVLGRPDLLTASYPAYPEQGWRVRVRPDATLTDLDTGRTLYCLFWEGRREEIRRPDSGFIVAGADTAAFLEEKLALLGLNARETEEFILYWLPAMQRNPWNYIRFAGEEEIGSAMPLAISPAPDRVLRVWMEYTALAERPEGIPEQVLEPVSREELSASGFYAVEWGGSEF